MAVRKLALDGTAQDVGRLEEFCGGQDREEFAAGARLRALAVELARREELEVAAIGYEDQSLELEVVLAGDRFREPLTIDRDGGGRECQVSWERWTEIGDDAAVEKAAQMIAAIAVACAASR